MEAGNCLFTYVTVSSKKEILPTFLHNSCCRDIDIFVSHDPEIMFSAIIGFGNNCVATFTYQTIIQYLTCVFVESK
jgi:hypothetical protein